MNKCVSCQKTLQGKYCSYCGEKVLDPEQRSLKHLFGMFTEELTSLNGKFVYTLTAFFLNPGQQCYDFHRGARKKYLSLFTVFFLFNIIYFLNAPLSDFSLSLNEQMGQLYSAWIKPSIEAYQKENQLSFEDIASQYRLVSMPIAKSIIIVSVPFLAFFIWILNPSKDYYAQDHFMFSLNIYAFILIFPAALKLFFTGLVYIFGDLIGNYFQAYLKIILAGFLYFLWRSHRMAYQSSRLRTTLLIVPIIIAVFASHMIYRFIQFWATWVQLT